MIGRTAVRRGLAVAAAAALLSVPIGLAPATAEPDYPPSFYKISADSFNAKVGGKVAFRAQTYQAGSAVSVDVSVGDASVGSSSATANGNGIATTSVTFTTEGINTVTMSGTSDTGEPLSLSARVTVTAADDDVTPVGDDNGNGNGGSAAGGSDAGSVPFLGGGLPRTGGEIAGTVLVAVVLVGLGALLVVFTRRRRTS